MRRGTPRRIAVLRAGALGDFLLGLPALGALRRAFPSARLTVVGPPPQVLFALDAAADAVADIGDAPLAGLFVGGAAALPDALSGTDAAVVWLNSWPVVAANLRRLGAAAVVAAPPFPPPDQRRHVADWLLDSLRPLGVAPPPGWDREPWLPLAAGPRTAASRWLAGRLAGEPFVVVHPGSGSERKNWPAGNWAGVLQTVAPLDRYGLVVAGGPADDRAVDALVDALAAAGRRPDALLRGLELPLVAAVLERCALYLGNDSGITHLAAAAGAPAVAVFGPTDPAVWRPRGPTVRVLGGAADPAGGLYAAAPAWPDTGAVAAAAAALLRR